MYMKKNKGMLKILSMSFLLTSLVVTSPVVTPITHAAGTHGEGTGTDDKWDEEKKREEEEKRKREEETKRKENEERIKEIIKRVVQVEVKDEATTGKEETEKLLKDLPTEILEMYDKVGGKIRVVDGNLAEHPDLKDKKVMNSEGREESLQRYYVYSTNERGPEVFIRATDEYEGNIALRENVYSEIGRSLVRDVLRPEGMMDSSFIDAVNRTDSDGRDWFFSKALQSYTTSLDFADVKTHIENFQDIFAKGFAYYSVPEYKEALQAYAPSMYEYFNKLDWNQLKGKLKNEALDFGKDIAAAEFWVQENLKGLEEKLSAAEKQEIIDYTTGHYQYINSYLRNPDTPRFNDPDAAYYMPKEEIEPQIARISEGLKKLALPTDMVVYRRVQANTFKPDPNTSNLPFDFNKTEDIERFKKQYEGSIIEEKGFLSTAIVRDPDLSSNFLQYRILMRITLPKGTYAGYLPGLKLGSYQGEYEMLVDHGYMYRIDKVGTVETETHTRKKTDVFIEATILPKNE
ncbi:hypothetical protein BK702_02900 [Bacillus thuringiensis serovar cameroun]|nr:vegetative insecticidal protein cry2920b [Bacillus thuringiensis]OTW94376.1 hypothetical protein BK702_02900 [Bacillus thuringiensis serovar cameroun]WBO26483.1 Vip-like1 [Bacillus thuringiensis]